METVSKSARKEILAAVRVRYEQASKLEKGKILSEFAAVAGYHRKHAIRLLSPRTEVGVKTVIEGGRIYGAAVKAALVLIWETADRICGKRLKAAMPHLVSAMERHGHLKLDAEVRKQVLLVSAATMDRMLTPERKGAGIRRKRRLPKKLRKEIPIKTFADWKDSLPGFLEIDFVVHGGGSMAGEYLHSLVATDVCSGWVEAVPLLAREQALAVAGLVRIRKQMHVTTLGIDSDNDGAFINETVASYCKAEGLAFTRSRPHHKNDQAWIEQKNGAVIRRMVGHERFSGIVAGQALAQLLAAVRLYVNYFQPSFKLRERIRVGAKVKKSYHPPATPCDRLLAHAGVVETVKTALRTQRDQLDPVELLHRIRQGQAALAALSTGEPSEGPDRNGLDQFLASLPELWREGEARPTHRQGDPKVRYWRTREDPFKDVWTDILLWLQKEPDSSVKLILQKLEEKYPGQFDNKLLRTLQRRVGEWRRTMARRLVFGGVEERDDLLGDGGRELGLGGTGVPLGLQAGLAELAILTDPDRQTAGADGHLLADQRLGEALLQMQADGFEFDGGRVALAPRVPRATPGWQRWLDYRFITHVTLASYRSSVTFFSQPFGLTIWSLAQGTMKSVGRTNVR